MDVGKLSNRLFNSNPPPQITILNLWKTQAWAELGPTQSKLVYDFFLSFVFVLFRVPRLWVTRFVLGTQTLSVKVCSRYQGIESQGLFVVLRIWVLRFVAGKNFQVTTSTRNFEKNQFFRQFFSPQIFLWHFWSLQGTR